MSMDDDGTEKPPLARLFWVDGWQTKARDIKDADEARGWKCARVLFLRQPTEEEARVLMLTLSPGYQRVEIAEP